MDYTIYVLAEGKSSRMGEDKGLVKINGTEMVKHCIENLKPLQQEIVLVTSNPAYDKFGCRIIADSIKHQGPALGILTALEDTHTEKNIIVSCDMPLVAELMIREFDDYIIDSDIVCFMNNYLFPFPAMYSKSILKNWEKILASGERKLQVLIPQFNYKTLPIKHPDLFLNVNTPEDITYVSSLIK